MTRRRAPVQAVDRRRSPARNPDAGDDRDREPAAARRGGIEGFSLPKLGRALGADPTAVYRHFASKDDIVLAIADRLIEEAMDGLAPASCWVDTLIDMARRLRAPTWPTPPPHPSPRTGRPRARQRCGPSTSSSAPCSRPASRGRGRPDVSRDRGLRVVLGGLRGHRSWPWMSGCSEIDRSAWTRAYLAVDRAEYPNIWQIRTELPRSTTTTSSRRSCPWSSTGLVQRAPRPCECPVHGQRTVAS